MKTSATNRKIHVLLTALAEKKLNPRPDFQRRLVWTNDDKTSFINTVLRGLPFPEIYVCAGTLDPETAAATEFLVDGQQRITTLAQYFRADPSLRLGRLRPYAQLTKEEKEAFLEYEVVVRDLGKHDLAQIREIFELINSANYALNSIEIRNARYSGAFKKFCEGVAERPEFKDWKIFRLNDVRRMQDLRYCLVIVATLLSTYFNRDEDIDEYLERYNDGFPDEDRLRSEIDTTFQFLRSLQLPAESRAFRKTDFFSLFVEVHRALFKRRVALQPPEVSARLLAFFREVDSAAAAARAPEDAVVYYRSTVRAAIDRGNRVRRGELLQGLLDSSYEPQLRFSWMEDRTDVDASPVAEVEEGEY